MSDGWLGEIRCFPYSQIPRGWNLCDGSILQIQQNAALFSLLGNRYYGGNGTTTFALPDLRGRVPLHMNPTDSSCSTVGQAGGMDSVTLTTAQMPSHTHNAYAISGNGNTPNPATSLPASVLPQGTPSTAPSIYGPWSATPGSTVTLSDAAVQVTGGSQSHENRQPTMALNWCICVAGVYPTRN